MPRSRPLRLVVAGDSLCGHLGSEQSVLKASCPALLILFLVGCATGLKQDGRCLASLTPDVLAAQQELDVLESDWRAALDRLDQHLITSPSASARMPPQIVGPVLPTREIQPVALFSDAQVVPDEAQRVAHEAYGRLAEARIRHQATMQWYERVYDRLRTRQEEEEVLSQARMVLITGPGLLLYPVIRWNVHSVFWDGQDPDAESDRISQFCTRRLEVDRQREEARSLSDQAATRETP